MIAPTLYISVIYLRVRLANFGLALLLLPPSPSRFSFQLVSVSAFRPVK